MLIGFNAPRTRRILKRSIASGCSGKFPIGTGTGMRCSKTKKVAQRYGASTGRLSISQAMGANSFSPIQNTPSIAQLIKLGQRMFSCR